MHSVHSVGRALTSRRALGGIVGGAGAVMLVSITYASIPDADGVIHGCYKKSDQSLRVVDTAKGEACEKNETPLVWNERGPQGDPGDPGAPGPPGTPGEPGAPGTSLGGTIPIASAPLISTGQDCALAAPQSTSVNTDPLHVTGGYYLPMFGGHLQTSALVTPVSAGSAGVFLTLVQPGQAADIFGRSSDVANQTEDHFNAVFLVEGNVTVTVRRAVSACGIADISGEVLLLKLS